MRKAYRAATTHEARARVMYGPMQVNGGGLADGSVTLEQAVKAVSGAGFDPFRGFQDKTAHPYRANWAPGIAGQTTHGFEGLRGPMSDGHTVVVCGADMYNPDVVFNLFHLTKAHLPLLEAMEADYGRFLAQLKLERPESFASVLDCDEYILGFHVMPSISACLHAHAMPIGAPLTPIGVELEHKFVSFDVVRSALLAAAQ